MAGQIDILWTTRKPFCLHHNQGNRYQDSGLQTLIIDETAEPVAST
jgi:hypothetical protein